MQNVLDMKNTNDDDDENERVMMIEVECNVFLRAEHTRRMRIDHPEVQRVIITISE